MENTPNKDKWNRQRAISVIERNGGIVSGRAIYAPSAGIKVLGAVDYLVKFHGFIRTKQQPH